MYSVFTIHIPTCSKAQFSLKLDFSPLYQPVLQLFRWLYINIFFSSSEFSCHSLNQYVRVIEFIDKCKFGMIWNRKRFICITKFLWNTRIAAPTPLVALIRFIVISVFSLRGGNEIQTWASLKPAKHFTRKYGYKRRNHFNDLMPNIA